MGEKNVMCISALQKFCEGTKSFSRERKSFARERKNLKNIFPPTPKMIHHHVPLGALYAADEYNSK